MAFDELGYAVALDADNTLLAEAITTGTTEPQTGQFGCPNQQQAGEPGEADNSGQQQPAVAPAVSFVIYYDPNAGTVAVGRYRIAEPQPQPVERVRAGKP